jgi:regulator of protease activity HflC (stomatin/prohibitin superfamily)
MKPTDMEKQYKPLPGLVGLVLSLAVLGSGVFLLTRLEAGADPDPLLIIGGALLLIIGFFLFRGLVVIQPNHSRVLNFFGTYVGTVKENGWFYVNPFFTKENISLRAQNLESAKLKVNDKMGNPIEIAAVIVWQVGDT